jgi:N-methylhydantoinase A/oxoprolinase/acetone carboxylase beta subunit
MNSKAEVLEFCSRLRVVCDSLTEEQCHALQETGTLGALHAALLAARAGQVAVHVDKHRMKSILGDVLHGAVTEVVKRVNEEGSRRAKP